MSSVFIDSAGWLALANRSDRWHSLAVQTYERIARDRWRRVTTDAVIIEVCNALRRPFLRPLAAILTDNLRKAERRGHLEIIHVTPELIERGLRLFRERKDKEWSLTDCISFVVMKQSGIAYAFTTDHHFQQAGFVRLLEEQ